MFVHLVLIKLKPGVTRADPRVPAWEAKFAALEHKCKGIVRFEYGWNTTDRPIAFDFGVPHESGAQVVGALRPVFGLEPPFDELLRDDALPAEAIAELHVRTA